MDHFGVRIYPEDFNKPYPGFTYGDRKLLEGLVYYDEGYDFNPEYYGKKIEKLLQKRK